MTILDRQGDMPDAPQEAAVREVPPPDDYLAAANGDEAAARAAFLGDIRKWYADDTAADHDNRRAALEDMAFVAGTQWDPGVAQERLLKGRPVMTINRLPAFVAQVTNQRRMSDTSIRVHPDAGGDREVARIRQGLIRSIEKQSRAKIAYQRAHESQVVCGEGAFQIGLVYAASDVFEQDAVIEPIHDALSVVWDRMSVDPTGRDAGHVFVEDLLTREQFERAYPGASAGGWSGDPAGQASGWHAADSVRVVSLWRMRRRKTTLALLQDRSVVDISGMPPEQWEQSVVRDPATGRPMLRGCDMPYAELYVSNGTELLDGPYVLPVGRVPVFRVVGWDMHVGSRRERWGLVRHMKDPQRLHNYWRSVIAERLMQAPRNVWIAPDAAVDGREMAFRKAAQSDDPLLVYNSDTPAAPARVDPAQLEPALMQEAMLGVQDLRDVSNIHEASLGIQSNEVSGKAIIARQRVGEVGVAMYQDNLNLAIEECGRTLNELIPHVYGTERTLVVLGDDDREEIVRVNQMSGGMDLAVGRYRVSISTGPSFVTKRIEAAESMLNMVNAVPQTMAVALDKIVEAQDWPGADEIARRLRTQLPDDIVDPDDLSQEEQQQRQAMGQQKAEQAELARRGAEAQVAQAEAQVAETLAKARQQEADAEKKRVEAEVAMFEAQARVKKERLDGALDTLRTAKELQTPPKAAERTKK